MGEMNLSVVRKKKCHIGAPTGGSLQSVQTGKSRVHTFPLSEKNVVGTCNSLEPQLQQQVRGGRADRVSKSSSTALVAAIGAEAANGNSFSMTGILQDSDELAFVGDVTLKAVRR
jgi:hypothetical protein